MALEESVPGRTVARMARQVEIALDTVDLSLPQYRILGVLGDGPSVASALAERLAVSRPAVTAAVAGLVTRGLVTRSPDPRDRRRIQHTLTSEGELALVAANQAIADRLDEIGSNLTEQQQQGAYEGMRLWRSALDTGPTARLGTSV